MAHVQKEGWGLLYGASRMATAMNRHFKKDQAMDLSHQMDVLKSELEKIKQDYRLLQQQYQALKVQNERLLKMEAEHQKARTSLIHKKIILSRAVLLVSENMVIGDHMENCIIKIYRGNSLVITDSAVLINCRILQLDEYPEDKKTKAPKPIGTIEIKGVFCNSDPRKFAISSRERVLISRGARFEGNVCAETIVITETTRIRGRFASRDLLREKREKKAGKPKTSNVLEFGIANSI